MIICKKAYREIRYALHTLSIIVCMLLASCEWVNDDLSGCETGTWLHFSYTYNILDVDAAYNQVENMSLLIFDNDSRFIARQDVDSLQFAENNAMVEIEQPQGDYKVLVWGGLCDTNYNLSDLVVGETLYEDVVLTLSKSDEASENSELFSSLFHCSLDNITVADYYNIYEASLVKDTNHLSVLIQIDGESELQQSDFGVVLRSDNGALDYHNSVIADNYVNYTPHSIQTDEVTNTALDGTVETSTVFVSQINTLRLLVGDETTLTVVQTATDDRIIDISLVQYLLFVRDYGYSSMGKQEYLDRQYSYSLVLFLEESGDSFGTYLCTKVSVNGWIVRFNDAELSRN